MLPFYLVGILFAKNAPMKSAHAHSVKRMFRKTAHVFLVDYDNHSILESDQSASSNQRYKVNSKISCC